MMYYVQRRFILASTIWSRNAEPVVDGFGPDGNVHLVRLRKGHNLMVVTPGTSLCHFDHSLFKGFVDLLGGDCSIFEIAPQGCSRFPLGVSTSCTTRVKANEWCVVVFVRPHIFDNIRAVFGGFGVVSV